jgi:two-component system NarL family sensor kinase
MNKITGRQPAAEILRQSERFLRLVEVMPVAVYVCDTSGIIQSYNHRAVELWGREARVGDSAERYCGSLRLYSPDGELVPHQESKMAEVLRTGVEARDLEVVIERPDGSWITVLVNIVPLRDDDGELIGAMNCFQEITDRKLAEGAVRRSERLLRSVLDALPVGVAVVDLSGEIILSNPASQRIWSGSIPSGRERYAKSKAWWHATGKPLGPGEWASVRAFVNGETSVNQVLDIEAFDGVRKTIHNSAVPIWDTNGRITGAVVVNEDISARKTVERELNDSYNQMRALSGRLMRAQDDERRRIARMLHETTAQDLAALKMLLARLNRTADRLDDGERSALTESMSLAEQAMTQIRTLSYLLHPPFLDETGLLPALRWYAAGFTERSGITVDLELPESFERLPLDTETALFRIVQESLINIHRHAGSETARIRLRRDAETLVLEIEDRGHGISKALLKHITSRRGGVGVGIAGMSERIEQLGGRLEITSSDHGTTVHVGLGCRSGRRPAARRREAGGHKE